MNKKVLFKILTQKSQKELLELLGSAWKVMNTNQRDEIFSSVMQAEQYDYPASAEETLAAVKTFYARSLAGDYYAPFDMNSKNFMDMPEETDAWFARLDALLIECTKLSNQGEFHAALEAFEQLYKLIDVFNSGKEIVFADEAGMWMFAGDEKTYYTAYLKAAAHASSSDGFIEKALMVIQEDSQRSCFLKLYPVVQSLATPEQMRLIDDEVKRKKLKVAAAESC